MQRMAIPYRLNDNDDHWTSLSTATLGESFCVRSQTVTEECKTFIARPSLRP